MSLFKTLDCDPFLHFISHFSAVHFCIYFTQKNRLVDLHNMQNRKKDLEKTIVFPFNKNKTVRNFELHPKKSSDHHQSQKRVGNKVINNF